MSNADETLKGLTKCNPDKSINSHEAAGLLLSHFLSFYGGSRIPNYEIHAGGKSKQVNPGRGIWIRPNH
jgi:hypothetical protein